MYQNKIYILWSTFKIRHKYIFVTGTWQNTIESYKSQHGTEPYRFHCNSLSINNSATISLHFNIFPSAEWNAFQTGMPTILVTGNWRFSTFDAVAFLYSSNINHIGYYQFQMVSMASLNGQILYFPFTMSTAISLPLPLPLLLIVLI